jgi:hypothetical protein
VAANAFFFFQSVGDEGIGNFNASTVINRSGSSDAPILDLRFTGGPQQQQIDFFETQIMETVLLGPGLYTATTMSEARGGRSFFTGAGSLSFSSVPEPAGLVLLGAGLVIMLGRRRRRAP